MIAVPSALDEPTVDAWVGHLDSYVITDAFVKMVSGTPFAAAKAEQWKDSEEEWTGRAGWNLLALLAMRDSRLDDDLCGQLLDTIEREIHGRKNRVRDAMNSALTAIGLRNEALTRKALEVAARIGKVEVDHGETVCKTPDAASYIQRTLERRKTGTKRRVNSASA
jgi:3-methyladenine DNA glycosylase AlkD